MKETKRDDGFEATFVVATPRAEAWARLAAAGPAFDALPKAREGQWWVPAIEAPADELEVKPEELLRVRKAIEPCKGTEITVTLEDEESGTRITIVQTGFGSGFASARPWLTAGWYQILADFVVFFERGVSLGRHASMWWGMGCDVEETAEGLVVRSVAANGYAASAGLQPGDLILQLMGAPVLTINDLSMITRGPFRTGVDAKVRYLRGNAVMTGSATVT